MRSCLWKAASSCACFIQVFFTVIVFICSCSGVTLDDEDGRYSVYKVAVIMPVSEQVRWERTVGWALDNFTKAQKSLNRRISLDIVWKDEDAPDLREWLNDIAEDNSYVAVIGPKTSVKAKVAAETLCRSKKTLILPIATSTELQRIYADEEYVWNLTQSDITQCEILLSQAKVSGIRYVDLLASDDLYGKSFSEWFAFVASEMGLETGSIVEYSSESQIRTVVRSYSGDGDFYKKALIFAPGKAEDLMVFDNEFSSLSEYDKKRYPLLLCSDNAYSAEVASSLSESLFEGICPCAAPESGFDSAYAAKFGEKPLSGEAHLFDAVYFLFYGLAVSERDDIGLNSALKSVVDGKDSWNGSWLPDDISSVLASVISGRNPDFSGVTGDWSFDFRYSSVLNSTYSYWVMHDGILADIGYVSTDGGIRTSSTTQAWQWAAENQMTFDRESEDFVYPLLQENWAVVIAGSATWKNYRHQADALAMYKVLKDKGFDDDHIIFIMEDDLAFNEYNVLPGVIRIDPNGENLYSDFVLDYRLSDIDVSCDLYDILNGISSLDSEPVLSSGPNDNVFIYWCGHGSRNFLLWGEDDRIGASDIRRIFSDMSSNDKFRKIFFAIEACYSGSIGKSLTGIPGLIVMTAANEMESSMADVYDDELRLWLSNGFSRTFQETVAASPDIILSDLYYKLARSTTGSHVRVYNELNYGNMYTNSFAEFLPG